MKDHSSGDDPLRARFNALRKSPDPPGPPQARFQSESPSAADDLESRFRRLGTPKRDDLDSQPTEEDELKDVKEEDVDVEALLKDVYANETQAHEDIESSKPWMIEAERILKEHREAEAREAAEKGEKSDAEDVEDTKDEADIMNSALDEADLEKKKSHVTESAAQDEEPNDPSKADNDGEEDINDGGDDLDSLIKLPSVPNAAPTSKETDTDDGDLSARLAALNLPTTLKPKSTSTLNTSGPQMPDIPDEEIESWCIICCDDATVRCLGCDNDLYCTDCWNEGHRSPEAGPEERKHRALAYQKPSGKKKEQRKKKVAA